MKTIDLTLPAHWASFLINGDASGLTDEEEKDVLRTLKHEGLKNNCLTCSEDETFTRYHDGRGPTCDGLVCNCLEFTFPVD